MSATKSLGTSTSRCINCKTPVLAGREVCPCGDRMIPKERAGLPLLPGQADPSILQDHVDRITGHPRMNVITLTEEQQRAVYAVAQWFDTPFKHSFRLFGPAGVGKTTIIKHITQALGVNAVFGAYTGKAAAVLTKKGVPATTIHSAIYLTTKNVEAKAEWEKVMGQIGGLSTDDGLMREVTPENQAAVTALEERAVELEAQMRRPAFQVNPDSEWAYADLIVLDEVSMVNRRMAEDIESFGVPVLVLGDPAQLPPVEGGGHYTGAAPDFELTEIHRQALESPVLALATKVRLGGSWHGERVPVSVAAAMEADQVLCWKNSTRWNLIERLRHELGRPKGVPVPGDTVICLVNNRDMGLLNGVQYDVQDVRTDDLGYELLLSEDGGPARWTHAFAQGFHSYEGEQEAKKIGAWRGRRGLFTFANCITVHKAQGSEWGHVYLVDQTAQMRDPVEARRWVYTAITRASERITVAAVGVR